MIVVFSLERVSAESTWIKHMKQDLCYTLDNHTTIGPDDQDSNPNFFLTTYNSFNYFV